MSTSSFATARTLAAAIQSIRQVSRPAERFNAPTRNLTFTVNTKQRTTTLPVEYEFISLVDHSKLSPQQRHDLFQLLTQKSMFCILSWQCQILMASPLLVALLGPTDQVLDWIHKKDQDLFLEQWKYSSANDVNSIKVHCVTAMKRNIQLTWYFMKRELEIYCFIQSMTDAAYDISSSLQGPIHQRIADMLPIGVVEVDPKNNRIIYCNAEYRYLSSEIDVKVCMYADLIRILTQNAFQSTCPRYFNERLIKMNGEPLMMNGVSIPVQVQQNPDSFHVIHFIRDNTFEHTAIKERLKLIQDLQNALMELSDAKQQMNDVIEAMPAAVFRIQVQAGQIEYMNSQYLKMMRITDKEWKTFNDLPNEIQPWIQQQVDRACLDHKPFTFEERLPAFEHYRLPHDSLAAPGVPIMRGFIFPILEQLKPVSVVFVLLDVTSDFRKADAQIRSRNAQQAVAEASRLKTEFLVHVSHELRTPLAGILGLLDQYQDEQVHHKAHAKNTIEKVLTIGNRLYAMIGNLLEYSCIEAGKMEPKLVVFNIEELIETVVHLKRLNYAQWCQVTNDEGNSNTKVPSVHVEYLFSQSGKCVKGDMQRIGQILASLLSNALQYTRPGTDIELQVDLRDHQLILHLADQGPGIAKDVAEYIYQPFAIHSSHSTTCGIGLGLPTAKRLAEWLGGKLWYQPRTDGIQGSIFSFSVPVEDSSPNESIHVEPPTLDRAAALFNTARPLETENFLDLDQEFKIPSSDSGVSSPVLFSSPSYHSSIEKFGGLCVMVVDDNLINTQVLCSFLKSLTVQVLHTCTDGLQAFQYYVTNTTVPIHMIFMDLLMPVMNGYASTGAIRANELVRGRPLHLLETACLRDTHYDGLLKCKHVPIVAVTANAMQEDADKCQLAGMNGYLTKPLTRSSIQTELLRILSLYSK